MADEEALRALWDSLPRINCRGLCADSCTAIDMSPLEYELTREAGVEIQPRTVTAQKKCVALSVFNRCRIYEARPTICRIYGLSRGLNCGYGCVPEGGFLSEEEMLDVLNRATFFGGGYPPEVTLEMVLEKANDPEFRQFRRVWLEQERGAPVVVRVLP